MPKLTPNLWFDTNAEEAATFYVSLFPNSRITSVNRSPADFPSGKAGDVVTVDWELDGKPFTGINGGTDFQFNESISFLIDCADQAEVDRYWDALTADGGEASMCGWLKDRFGVSWQVVPRQLGELIGGSDPAGARRAMETMLGQQKIDVDEIERAYRGEPATAR
jgi:predicted 3-demethylubiquinone-9 3-methyltransferase (glyoxalase superfamily)